MGLRLASGWIEPRSWRIPDRGLRHRLPGGRYPAILEPDQPLRFAHPIIESVIYGAAGVAQHPGMTRLLLERDADPNDGETCYHAPESYDNTVTQILLESGKLNDRSRLWILVRKADWHDYHGMGIESVLINCHYPVTPTSFLLQWGAIVRRPPGLSDAQASRVAAKFADFVGLGFQQDVEIWLHKTRIDNPLLCAEDGPVYQVRRWYEQFYRDVADVEPDMVARFEFEIDTTRAVAGWEAEVAANLARQADAS